MKILLINGFRKTRNHVLTWVSKQNLADWLLYFFTAIGFIVGIVVIFVQKLYELQAPFIAYFAFCMFLATISTCCYLGILTIIWLFKNLKS